VVRYPHTATITVVASTITDGELASETPTTQEIKGRREYAEGFSSRVQTASGDFTDLRAKFFTKAEKITGAEKLTVLGETFDIIRWDPLQTHSEIWLG